MRLSPDLRAIWPTLVGMMAAVLVPVLTAAETPAWSMKQAPLMTAWAKQVDPAKPLPDYPRPQLVRGEWLNLNGIWQYQPGAAGDALPAGRTLASSILVPFPVESALSGVMELHDRLWYRRTFTVPAAWAGKLVKLNFGAVDFESEVFVNGASVGVHKGGYDPFTYDITPFLRGVGPQELIVRVFDPTDLAGIPRGKQTTHLGGITYTSTTGIWQTVWLEPVATAGSIGALRIVPDVDHGAVRITVAADGAAGATVAITVKDGEGGPALASATGRPGSVISVPVPNAKLWSPDSPFLYGLDIALLDGDARIDAVGSYVGMRKIALGDVAGVQRILLNNQEIFQFGPLDQGFWPDGLYTAPTDEALKSDLVQIKALGFNMVRKHIKVEPARWYAWADRLGVLVWQDMPSCNSYRGHATPPPPVDLADYESELRRMIESHWNAPSIITWVVFNEGQGQPEEADTRRIAASVKALDPSRLVDEASGSRCYGAGDINDAHSYPQPYVRQAKGPATQANACGEFGGLGLMVEGHMWKGRGGGYENAGTPEDLVHMYAEYALMVKKLRDEQGLCAAVYTEVSDVESELNGFLTYDRVPKCDFAQVALATRFALPAPGYRPVLATSEATAQAWRYTTAAPAATWTKPKFDDAAWSEGRGGFGKQGQPGLVPGTAWSTPDIWLRRTFNPGPLTAEQVAHLVVRELNGGNLDVYINGELAYSCRHPVTAYIDRGLLPKGRAALLPGADNVITAHCEDKRGRPSVDVGLGERVAAGK